jgi:hypothetical protein
MIYASLCLLDALGPIPGGIVISAQRRSPIVDPFGGEGGLARLAATGDPRAKRFRTPRRPGARP